jgi:hypothetical protein
MKLPNATAIKARFTYVMTAFQIILSYYDDLKHLFKVLGSKKK